MLTEQAAARDTMHMSRSNWRLANNKMEEVTGALSGNFLNMLRLSVLNQRGASVKSKLEVATFSPTIPLALAVN